MCLEKRYAGSYTHTHTLSAIALSLSLPLPLLRFCHLLQAGKSEKKLAARNAERKMHFMYVTECNCTGVCACVCVCSCHTVTVLTFFCF
jgi:hypothetical protein